jgi:signal peptidase I
MRANADNWLELARKVIHYRRDVLPPPELSELNQASGKLRALLAERADASKLKLGIEHLEGVLRRTGGTFYPKSTFIEYVEFFLVAAIVILGIRAYFVQPFKIPTNSMWPSYYGMTGQVFHSREEEPGLLSTAFRFATDLAIPKRIDAPVDGEVFIPVSVAGPEMSMAYSQIIPGRKWFIVPTQLREYQLMVGRTPVAIRVPADFDLDRVLRDAFFDGADHYPVQRAEVGRHGLLRTGRVVKQGERILSFDVLTGDQLFVDRMSYHFVRPKVGQGFVFRTLQLPELHRLMPGPQDQYYIKRLVGLPGDTLEIQRPVLLRNGAPITGDESFALNARQEQRYPGYRYAGRMQPGVQVTVPPNSYFALGDNSASSLDSRYWGSVPAKDAVGRPLFIYYPFTRRWGPAN